MDLNSNNSSSEEKRVPVSAYWAKLDDKIMNVRSEFDMRTVEQSTKSKVGKSQSNRKFIAHSSQCKRFRKSTASARLILAIAITLIVKFTVSQQNQQQQEPSTILTEAELPQTFAINRAPGFSPQAAQPSQLFLSPVTNSHNGQPISLVGGFHQKKSEEEEDGFIMQSAPLSSSSAQSETTVAGVTTNEPSTLTTAQTDAIDTTTSISSSGLDGTTVTATTMLPTIIRTITSEQDDLQGRIPIDVNRQQFVTHDQLSLPIASTKDESINLSPPSVGNIQSTPPRTPTSRAGMSKVSHVSSFLSDLFAYATRAHPEEAHFENQADSQGQRNWSLPNNSRQHSNTVLSGTSASSKPPIESLTATATATATTITNTQQQQIATQKTLATTCPGICRSILTASILCNNEINAPCPTFLQKCCEKDNVSFNGTPVETSAPLPSTDIDANSPPLPDSLPQGQDQAPLDSQASLPEAFQTSATTTNSVHQERQTTAAATTARDQSSNGAANSQQLVSAATPGVEHSVDVPAPTDQRKWLQSGQPRASSSASSTTTNSRAPTPSPIEQLLAETSSLPAGSSIYFLSSGSSSSSELADKQQQSAGLTQPANEPENAGTHFKQSASQSFDSPVSKRTSNTHRQQQPVILETANGAILHHPSTERPSNNNNSNNNNLQRRPAYANWTDYHMSLLHNNKQHSQATTTSQTIVYHSNIDPAKKFVSDTSSNTTSATTILKNSNNPSDLSSSQQKTPVKDDRPICTGFCMPKIHRRFCQSQSAPNNQFRCENDEHEFCCTQSSEEVGSDNSIRRTLALPTEVRHSSPATNSAELVQSEAANQTATTREPNETQTKVINDQHSANSKSSRPGSLPKWQQESATSQFPQATTLTPPTTTITTQQQQAISEQPVPAVESVGNVLVDLLDSWISGASSAPTTNAPTTMSSGVGQPAASESSSQDNSEPDLQQATSNQQNDRRLGYDLSFRQHGDQLTPQASNSAMEFGGLITSDGGTEAGGIILGAPIESAQASKCTGYCALPLFTMLCDSTYRSADCGPSQKCCVIGRPNSGSGGGDEGTTDSADQLVSGGGNNNNRQTSQLSCRGSCLPVYHSSLCTKPNELQVDSPGCLPNFVCCNQPQTTQDQSANSGSLDDLSGLLNADSSQSHKVLLGDQSPQLPAKDTSFLASLLPPPPPPLATSTNSADQLQNINDNQYLSVSGRQRQSGGVSNGQLSPSAVQESAFFPLFGQQPTNGRPSSSKTNQQSGSNGGVGSGIMSHIYNMFKSSASSSKQRQQRPPSSQQAQTTQLPSVNNFVPQLYDPYQQLQVSASALRPNAALAPQQNPQQIVFNQHGLLMPNAGTYQANQASYAPVDGLLAQDLRPAPSRNRFTQQQQLSVDQHHQQQQQQQQFRTANPAIQKFNNQPQPQAQQPKVQYQQQQSPQHQMLPLGLNQFGEVNQLIGIDSSNLDSSLVSFNGQANFNQQQPQVSVKQRQHQQQVVNGQKQQQQQPNSISFPSGANLPDRQRYNADNAQNLASFNQAPPKGQQWQNQFPLYSGQTLAFGANDANGASGHQMLQQQQQQQQHWQQSQQQPVTSRPAPTLTNGQTVRAQQQQPQSQYAAAGHARVGSGQSDSSNLDQMAGGSRPASLSPIASSVSSQRQNPVSRAPLQPASSATMSPEIRAASVETAATSDVSGQQGNSQSFVGGSNVNRASQQHPSTLVLSSSVQKMNSDPIRRNNANDGANANSDTNNWSATRMAGGGSGASMTKAPSIEQVAPPSSRHPPLPALSSSSSNLNVLISTGPFIDLQRVDNNAAKISASSSQDWRNQASSAGSSSSEQPKATNNRRQQQQQVAVVPTTPMYDLSSSGEQQQCPSRCLAPFVSFNCIKPNYIDESLSCPNAGALCCVRAPSENGEASVAIPGSSIASSSSSYQQQLSTTQPAAFHQSTANSIVGTNKLDFSTSTSLSDQEDQLGSGDDEQGRPGEVSMSNPVVDPQQQHQDSSVAAAASDIDEQSSSDSSSGKNKVQSTVCGLPGPRGRTTSGRARGRVMGGFDSKPDYWCWQAALMNNKNEYLCGGALIGAKWVLTAAHCITQHLHSESQLFVRLGQHNLNLTQQTTRQTAKTIQVKTSYVHHNHNGITLDNDIALIRLEESVDLDEPSVCLVCLPERSSSMEPGKRCTVTGYGFENESGPAALRVRQTELPIMGDQECQNKTSAVLGKPFALPASSFCAGGELGQDACHGDGGSPLSCLIDGYYELTGIVSWGYKCGSKDLPGLYSKVSAFVGWINQIVSVNN